MAATDLAERARVSLTNLKNVTIIQSLAKTSGVGGLWNAAAGSADFIEGDGSQRIGISCSVPPRPSSCAWMMGLFSALHDEQREELIAHRVVDWRCLTYAACVASDCTLWVYENGKHCGYFDSVQSGDQIEIVLNSSRVEYRINGKLQYKSNTRAVFPLFPQICASGPGPVAEDLSWILRSPSAPSILRMQERQPVTQIAELKTQITEMQSQLETCEEANRALQLRLDDKEAEKEALQGVLDQVQKERAELQLQLEAEREAARADGQKKAANGAWHSVLDQMQKEQTDLPVQLEAEREASRAAADKKEHAMWPQGHDAAPCATSIDDRAHAQEWPEPETAAAAAAASSPAVVDENMELPILALRLQEAFEAFQRGAKELIGENAQLQAEKKEMHAELEEFRRHSLQSCETSTEAWEDAGSSAAASSAGGQAELSPQWWP